MTITLKGFVILQEDRLWLNRFYYSVQEAMIDIDDVFEWFDGDKKNIVVKPAIVTMEVE